MSMQAFQMTDLVEELFADIAASVNLADCAVLVQGGYTDLHLGTNEFSLASARTAMTLGRYLKESSKPAKPSLVYSILVNDLGQVCDADACTLNSQPSATAEACVDAICSYAGWDQARVLVQKESTLRNRGLRKLRKIHKSHSDAIVFGDDSVTLKSNQHKEIVLAKVNNGILAAKCPTIMGAYYAWGLEVLHNIFPVKKQAVIVDFCLIHDKDKVMKGAEVALNALRKHGQQAPVIIPVFCDQSCSVLLPEIIFPSDV